MKLVTSTGDFSHYVETVPQKVRNFKGGKFKYINLEQSGSSKELFSENNDDWKKFADELGNAAAFAGVSYVVSHAPCLNVYHDMKEENL